MTLLFNLFLNSLSSPTWLASVIRDDAAAEVSAEDDVNDDSLVESEAMTLDDVTVRTQQKTQYKVYCPRTESIAISQKLLPCSTASQLYQASAGCVPSTVAPVISNTVSLPGDKISVVVVDHFYCCC